MIQNTDKTQTLVNKKNIPLEYKIALQGKMNKGVYDCINSHDGKCSSEQNHRKNKYKVIEDIIGFAESQWGTMVVWECKDCGQIQFFHLRENEKTSFDYVSEFDTFHKNGSY